MFSLSLAMAARMRTRLVDSAVLYLAAPVRSLGGTACPGPETLAPVLTCGDVLLTQGNTRAAALVKRVTRSRWSHVSLYVGPLEEGPDPRCIVEADIAAGVRAIRLSELNALQVRVLRPVGLDHGARSRLAQWVVDRIGSEYDLAHAWALARKLLRLPAGSPSAADAALQGATRFICCSLLAHAFASVGTPLRTDPAGLTPGDFERAPDFQEVSL
jgi:hypothetical protein